MGFIKKMVDNNFIVDENNQTIFYPWGKFATGYIIQNREQEEKLRRFFSAFTIISLCLLFLFLVTIGPGFAIIPLPFSTLIFFLWVRRATRGLSIVPPASHIPALLWKIYSWFILIILGIDSIKSGINQTLIGLKLLDFVFSIWAILGLFLYAYKKAYGNGNSWKVFFVFYVIWTLTYDFIIEPLSVGKVQFFNNLFGLVLFGVPLYIALYQYAFKFMSMESEGDGWTY